MTSAPLSTTPEVPGRLAKRLAALGIQATMVERLHSAGLSWEFVEQLANTRGLRTGEDVRGLLTLHRSGLTPDEIYRWARLGSLDAASRLDAKDVPFEVVAAFPLGSSRSLTDLLRMVQAATPHGMRVEDLPLWHTGGVLTLAPPWVVAKNWARWRSVAVHAIGMRRAAVAVAAGLSPEEAVAQVTSGEFDEAMLRLLAGLRAGDG